MLKKRILILSGKIYRGVLKLTNLEANYLEIDLTAHFLSPGDYIFVIRIGEYSEKLRFNGEKLYVKIPFGMPFEGALEAAVIERTPLEILMSASTERCLSLSFNRLLEEYANPVPKQNGETSASKKTAEKPASPVGGATAEPGANDAASERIEGTRLEKEPDAPIKQAAESGVNGAPIKQTAEPRLVKETDAPIKQAAEAPVKQTADTGLGKESDASLKRKADAAPEQKADAVTGARSKESQAKKGGPTKPPAEDGKKTTEEKSFFDDIKESITEFFEKYPPYEELAAIVPSSKWVKVDTEDTFYVVGLLFNTSGITHICYGIPGEYSVKPPSDILTEWLPLNPEEWDKAGFWMIYQNAETGQI